MRTRYAQDVQAVQDTKDNESAKNATHATHATHATYATQATQATPSVDDVMNATSYGRAALKKFGAVPPGFVIYKAEWLGKKPEDWVSMRVSGAQFKDGRRVANTLMSTIVTREEMEAE